MEALPVRTGQRGALERPYRSTDAQRPLAVHGIGQDDLSRQVHMAIVAVHHAELAGASPSAASGQFRSTTRIAPGALAELNRRIEAVIADYLDRDDPDGTPVNLLWSFHELEPPAVP